MTRLDKSHARLLSLPGDIDLSVVDELRHACDNVPFGRRPQYIVHAGRQFAGRSYDTRVGLARGEHLKLASERSGSGDNIAVLWDRRIAEIFRYAANRF